MAPTRGKAGLDNRNPRLALTALAILAVAGLGLAVVAVLDVRAEQSSRRNAVERLQARLAVADHRVSSLQARAAALQAQNTKLAKRVGAAQKSRLTVLASRIRRSVFTVETPGGFGTGWAAWRADGVTYLITAAHVAQYAITHGTRDVTVNQHGRSWPGVVVSTDSANDLAVIRVSHLSAPPLWQRPNARASPVVGDQILLVGSPFGLQGTVTTGVVSRIGGDQIITDAAANPGNSGGPAVDADGRVVGVLRSTFGEDLSFLVPIGRACITVRPCTSRVTASLRDAPRVRH
jgi:S1-C subfamily serine protease